ncbi:MAG: glycosyltransferase family 1 protein [Synechococcaceae bacterium WBB_10_009]|nr:glycosyltransferase family 1 protein [Synechococcaceae bacterium WBB_10_009]
MAWSQLRLSELARQHRASLIFTPAPEGYLGRQAIPQVVMVHDLRPISHPERSLQSLYFRAWVPPLLRQCRRILTNSAFTAQEIERWAGVPEQRISVIPLGYDAASFRPAAGASGLPSKRPYLLHVGQAYPHKNLPRLIEAFAALAPQHPDLQLVLAGKPHPTETPRLEARVRERGLEARVQLLPYAPSETLVQLYQGALALVYPSLWEGFGLPVLEAMACGTPVLTSYGSGTEEAAGDAALLVDPANTAALAAALRDLVEQPSLRQQLRQRGLQRAAQFSWERTAAATHAALVEILSAVG